MKDEERLVYKNRIALLRQEMQKENIDLFLITGLDAGLVSSCDEYWDSLNFISGFHSKGDGSVLVSRDKAYFFCDSRYTENIFNSIDKELFLLVPLQHCSTPQEEAICFAMNYDFKKTDKSRMAIAANSKTVPYNAFRRHFKPNDFVFKSVDLIDKIWEDRPSIPKHIFTDVENFVFGDSKKYIFEHRSDKLKRITDYIESRGDTIDAFLTTMEDEVAYTLNLRAFDGGYSQSAMSMLVVMSTQAYLFTDATIDKTALEDFNNISSYEETGVKKIFVFDYSSINDVLPSLLPQGSKIGVSHGNISMDLIATFAKGKYLGFDLIERTPSLQMSMKNDSEIEGMRIAHINDGVAFVRFLYHELNINLKSRLFDDNKTMPSEEELALEFVKEKKDTIQGYITESFEPIVAFGKNAKCPHYTYINNNITFVSKNSPTLMLMDTGSQYEYGTTDFTRTIAINGVKEEWKRDYTLVLKAHLSVIMGKYRIGKVTGYTLDTIARSVLWNNGDDFEHGTGHSIECWGNVHGIYPRLSSNRSASTDIPLGEGMMFSVEPGLYSRKDYGIRIENIVMVNKEDKNNEFFTLESLTLCPYDRTLIDKTMLDDKMIEYINKYHERVFNTLLPYLTNPKLEDEKVVEYLREITKPL